MDNYTDRVEKGFCFKVQELWYRTLGFGPFLDRMMRYQREIERQRFKRILFLSLPCSCGTEYCLMHDTIKQVEGENE